MGRHDREKSALEAMGYLDVDDGLAPIGDAAPDAKPVDPEIETLRDPVTQFRFIHEDTRDERYLDMRAEVLLIDQICGNAHVTRADEPPERCMAPRCGSTKFETRNEIVIRTVRLPLQFTQREIHRKKVWDAIEHFVMVFRAEMLRHHPTAEITPEWLAAHRGYTEVGMTSPQAQQVIREFLVRMEYCTSEVADGLETTSLTAAAIALWGLRAKRADDLAASLEKKPSSPAASPSGSHASMAH